MNKILFPIMTISVIAVALTGIVWYASTLHVRELTPPNADGTAGDGLVPPTETGEEENLVRIDSPKRNELISSPVTITGEARGFWFFEASFPITLLDSKGKMIGIAVAQAEGEWMTEDFVPFKAVLAFDPGDASEGTLVLEKDNPSGLPEFADAVSLPVRLMKESVAREFDGCVITGCSREVCSDAEVVTPCIYRESYACYAKAICERGSGGTCGWRQTPELTQCIASRPF